MHPKNSIFNHICLIFCLSLISLVTACTPNWEISIETTKGDWFILNKKAIEPFERFSEEIKEESCIPLERILVAAKHQIVEKIEIRNQEGLNQLYPWHDIAEDSWICSNGDLLIGDTFIRPDMIKVTEADIVKKVRASITDIAPTAAFALGLGTMSYATGKPILETQAAHVCLIFLDAFGYLPYQKSIQEGLIPYLSSLETPLMALTVYPPATVPSSASILTGATSEVHGVDERSNRKTETETLFDIAVQQGLTVRAVEGDALSFQLRNANFILSGDKDGDGTTNDDVFNNTLDILKEGMPDLLWVHFHGIDDFGHTYGPGSVEESEAIRQVDSQVKEIIDQIPEDSLIIIFADHGMHAVDDEGRKGNHGNLIAEDMLIPIFIIKK
jgi:hypothetical protein